MRLTDPVADMLARIRNAAFEWRLHCWKRDSLKLLSKPLRDCPQPKAFRPRRPTGARVATKNWQPRLISSFTRQNPIRIACIS